MKLYLLRPVKGTDNLNGRDPWVPWYDKAFGFIVRAESESHARALIIDTQSTTHYGDEGKEAWWNPEFSTCIELTSEGEAEIIMCDFSSA